MKLLVVENSKSIPFTIKNFLHDQNRRFSHITRQYEFDHLSSEEQLALLCRADAVTLQSLFVDKRLLEGVAEAFAQGVFRDYRTTFHIVGFVSNLNMWGTPRLTDMQVNEEFGFVDYGRFKDNISKLIFSKRLFNIQENRNTGKIIDIYTDPETLVITQFERFYYESVPILESMEGYITDASYYQPPFSSPLIRL